MSMTTPAPVSAFAVPWTSVYNTAQSGPRNAVARRGVIQHHMAGFNLNTLRRLVLGQVPGQHRVSYTAIAQDQRADLMLADSSRRPWSASSAYWDSAMRSLCLVNSGGAPGWPVSDASLETAAQVIAYWSTHEGWWPHRDGDPRTWTVIGHRELRTIHGASIPTACPGGVPLDALAHRAQQILSAPPPTLQGDGMFLLTSPSWRAAHQHVLITELLGAMPVADVFAVTMRRVLPFADLENDHDLQGQVELAWQRNAQFLASLPGSGADSVNIEIGDHAEVGDITIDLDEDDIPEDADYAHDNADPIEDGPEAQS